MFKSVRRQRGLGWFGLMFVFGTIAFFAIIVIKVGPLYMNHMTLVRVVKSVADNPEMGTADAQVVRRALEARWDVDYIQQIDDKDIKIKRGPKGRMLSYDYEARVNLFYNVFVVLVFKDDFPMRNSEGTASDL